VAAGGRGRGWLGRRGRGVASGVVGRAGREVRLLDRGGLGLTSGLRSWSLGVWLSLGGRRGSGFGACCSWDCGCRDCGRLLRMGEVGC